ncbi:DUF1289 domain-containing protein [Candidatus Woesearchaeota archaeon]|nr:DUF1289 domain-containing protein [Candidatus Woesearchaeota archaeon]
MQSKKRDEGCQRSKHERKGWSRKKSNERKVP